LLVGIFIEYQRKAKLSLKIEHPPTDRTYKSAPAQEARFVRVRLHNRPMPSVFKWLGRQAAVHCHGGIRFYHLSDGAPVFSNPMPIRWADSDEPISHQVGPDGKLLQFFDPAKYNAAFYRDCYAGDSEPIDVAARFDDDQDCYGWSNENYLPGKAWRNPEWKLPNGRYLVEVTVHSAGDKISGVFKLENSVARQHFRLMQATRDDLRRLSS